MAGVHDPIRDEFPSETAPASALPPPPPDPSWQDGPWIIVSRADADVALDEFAAEGGEAANTDAIAEFVLLGTESAATISASPAVAHDDGATVAVTLPGRPLWTMWWIAAVPLTALAGFLVAAGLDAGWSAVTTRPSERVVASAPRQAPTLPSASPQRVATPPAPPPKVTPTELSPPPSATRDASRRDVTPSRAVETIPSESLLSATPTPPGTISASPTRPIPPLSQVAATPAPSTTAPTGPRDIVPDTRASAAVEPRPTLDLPASLAPLAVERPPATVPAYPAAAASASPNVVPTTVSEDSAIAAVLEQYRGATSALDARAVAAIWPTTNTRALERAFGQLSSQELSFAACVTRVNGTQATADCEGATTYVPRVGNRNPRVESREWRFELRKVGQRWVIERVSAR